MRLRFVLGVGALQIHDDDDDDDAVSPSVQL